MTPPHEVKREKTEQKLQAIVSPSILDCDKAEWGASLDLALQGSAEWLHFDVMDNHFVPNLSFGPMVIASLRKRFPDVYFDVHFMVTEPEKYVDMLAKGSKGNQAGLLGFTFHIETTEPRGKTLELIQLIRDQGMDVGIALSPNTPIDMVLPYCHLIDLVLVMTVHPGFGGQKFMKDQMTKVRTVREKFPKLNIQVDGGVSPGETVEACAEAGANVIVSGSGVYQSKDVKAAIHALRKAVEDRLQ